MTELQTITFEKKEVRGTSILRNRDVQSYSTKKKERKRYSFKIHEG